MSFWMKVPRWIAHRTAFESLETLWLRALGLIYLAAFASLWPQVLGLIGSNGIAPASQFLTAVRAELGSRAFFLVPTLFWFGSGNALLLAACAVGCVSACLLVLNRLSRPASFVCFVLYLSIVVVGSPFTNFQWDALLLEAGFLALFAGAPLLLWAYRLLLFRLMFESGLVKLLSHDPNWRNGHALRFHFLTQPLPNPVAYYAYRLPAPILDGLTWATFAIELFAPFLLFAPRRVRYSGVALLAILQLVILLTGNYAFFNWLTLALCLWSLDPELNAKRSQTEPKSATNRLPRTVPQAASSVALIALMLIGCAQLVLMMSQKQSAVLARLTEPIASLEIVNTYGLFAVMTTTRPELVIEGSNDGQQWRPYNFRYKPGDVNRGLPWVAPYHPRLDWQMWFAALGTPGENPWLAGFVYRILRGDRAVLGLMEAPPFAKPPRYLRIVSYDYNFTRPAERFHTGAVWTRRETGIWYGPVSLGRRP